MNLKKLLLCISVAGMVASCTSDIDLYDVGVADEQGESEITVNVVPFSRSAETRVSFTAAGEDDMFSINFEKNDEFGICLVSNKNTHFPLKNLNKAGTSVKVKTTNTKIKNALGGKNCVLYYPEDIVDSDELSFVDQEQWGLNDTECLKEKIYYSSSSPFKYDKTTGNIVSVSPLSSIVVLHIDNLPLGEYSKIELINVDGEKPFYKNVPYEITDKGIIPLEEVADEKRSSRISLMLDGCDVDDDTEEDLNYYLSVYPTTTGNCKVKMTRTDGAVAYSDVIPSKELKAGFGYVFSCTLSDFDYEFVDLGLSVKWAKMNVGATSPEDDGNYYAWGETEPQSDNSYSWTSYKWSSNGSSLDMTKYCVNSYYGDKYYVDNKRTLEADDDAASVNLGGTWRMPTYKEMGELVNNCYWVWTNNYNETGKAGYIIYKVKSLSDKGRLVESGNTPSSSYSLSDSHIFLPAAGGCYNDRSYGDGVSGFYWTSSLEYQSDCAMGFVFESFEVSFFQTSRCIGQHVRAVCQ